MIKNVFEINHLNFFYGTKQALSNINLNIPEHSITALIGPSGCGKSTFLRCLNRMNELMSDCKMDGQILFYKKNIYDHDVDPILIRRKIGMVFQKPNPFPKSIYENIAWAPKTCGINEKEIPHLVERSLKQSALWEEVKDRLQESALSLSGGQQQRLCIARALAMNPSVLLLDEPCSALDPVATAKIEELLITLRDSYSLIMVTHNLAQASRVADETAFFLGGSLVEMSPTKDLFNSPQVDSTARYVSGQFG